MVTLRNICQSYPANSRNVPGISRTFLKAPKIMLNHFKIFRPLHHPPLKTSLVPETKTKHHTTKGSRERGGQCRNHRTWFLAKAPQERSIEKSISKYIKGEMGIGSLKLLHPPQEFHLSAYTHTFPTHHRHIPPKSYISTN